MAARLERLLTGLWAGLLLTIAALAAPAAFVLPPPDAGKVVGRLFLQEAWISLLLAAWLLWRRRRGDAPLLWGTVACTLLGYFALQPLMSAARSGQGALGFGLLHGVSAIFYGMKTALVLLLAWRAAAPAVVSRLPSS